eukprot:4051212-Pyramimonas_sp.AAC.1
MRRPADCAGEGAEVQELVPVPRYVRIRCRSSYAICPHVDCRLGLASMTSQRGDVRIWSYNFRQYFAIVDILVVVVVGPAPSCHPVSLQVIGCDAMGLPMVERVPDA